MGLFRDHGAAIQLYDDKKEILLLSFLTFIVSILCVRDVADIQINQVYILFAMTIPVIFLPYKYLVYYTCFVAVIIKGVNAYILLLIYIGLLIKNKNQSIAKYFFPIILLLVEFVDSIYFLSLDFYILYASYILLFFYILFDNDSRVNPDKCLQYLSYGLFVTVSLVSIGVLKNPLDSVFFQEGASRAVMGVVDSDKLTHFALNANELAYYSVVLISILFLGRDRIKAPLLIYFVMLSAAIVSGLLSQSRTWVMAVILVVILYILQGSFSNKLKFMFWAILFIFLLYNVHSQFFDMAKEGIQSRFDDASIKTAGNRTALFSEYNNSFFEHPEFWITGTGAMYYKDVIKASNSIHNGTQQIYICYGILGVLVYLSAIVVYYKKNCIGIKRGIISYIPICTTLFFIQSLQFLNPFHLMLPVALTTYAIRKRHLSISGINQ